MSKHNFEAETGKVLELLTHSIYSNKEIFLRELVSNASDAIDKARIKALTDTDYLGSETGFQISISRDESKNLLVIEDNGLGMTEDELHKNLGTIAKSGTKEFMEKLQQAKENAENNLIGQFGVGFYSAFMVADKVEVETKSNDSDKAFKWTSDGKSAYEVSDSDKTTRGTVVTLFIDEANKELVTEWKIKELIKKYSNYVAVPVTMDIEEKDDK
jgi:molecular chaperone HtpG